MAAAARSKLYSSVSAWLGVFCQYCYVIGVVGVGNCFCEVPSASFFSDYYQTELLLWDMNTRSHLIVRKQSIYTNVVYSYADS